MSKEKQIEEKHELSESIYMSGHGLDWKDSEDIAEQLYTADYRKQRVGEWKIKSVIHKLIDDYDEELYVECPFCQRTFWVPYEFDDEKIFKYTREHYPYCNCGAKMKGGEADA